MLRRNFLQRTLVAPGLTAISPVAPLDDSCFDVVLVPENLSPDLAAAIANHLGPMLQTEIKKLVLSGDRSSTA